MIAGFNQYVSAAFRAMDLAGLRETRVGIKPINQLLSSDTFEHFALGGTNWVSAHELRLCIDGLKDRYTLLGVGVEKSPHFDLMQRLQQGQSPMGSAYVRRMKAGTLDFRSARPRADASDLLDEFNRRFDAISSGRIQPVKVVRTGDKLSIVDGKHTAALLASLGRDVPCLDVTPIIHDSYMVWICRRMRRKPARYVKHLQFFAEVTGKRTE